MRLLKFVVFCGAHGDGWPVNGKLDKRLYGLGRGAAHDKAHHSYDVLEILQSLVDKSLLRQVEVEGDPRFSMLWTIREIGRAHV